MTERSVISCLQSFASVYINALDPAQKNKITRIVFFGKIRHALFTVV